MTLPTSLSLVFFKYTLNEFINTAKNLLSSDYQLFIHTKQSINLFKKQEVNPQNDNIIFYSPTYNPHTTIMYTNVADGHIQLARHFRKAYNMQFYYMLISSNDDISLDAFHFFYYSDKQTRHILCYQDPRWTFYEDGTPLPFEDLERYKLRIKKQRLNKEVILHYLRCAGWDIEDDNFWKPQGPVYLFER